MDEKELKETDTWQLFEQGRNYLRFLNVYDETDRNYQFYNGNQWEGAKIGGIEPVQFNFIETIVDYKLGEINANEWLINFSSDNFEQDFIQTADELCELLNRKARKVWERDRMDFKLRQFAEDAAVNSEGIIYADYDDESQSPVNEILNKCDVHYGNEQNEDIQSQPYILVSKRVPVIEAQKFAEENGATQEQIKMICGDMDSFENAGDDAKYEKDPMCTIVTKMWKEKGTVWFSKAVKYLELKQATDTKLTLYPVSHFLWKHKKGSARGEGEVKYLIPNQLEENKSLARSLLSMKQNAYPQKVADMSKITNPSAMEQVGGIIKTQGAVENVKNIFGYVEPAQMSADVFKSMEDLISVTRDLRNAGDIATGGVSPEDASGRAILAVQQASKQPLTKQTASLKQAIEDLARIWLDMWTVYTPEGMTLDQEVVDPQTGETVTQTVEVPATALENLKGVVKVEISPKGAYDRYAQELTLENFLKGGFFNAQNVSALRYYAESLPDDATSPKLRLLEICDKIEEEQQKIAEMNAQAQIMKDKALQFLSGDPDSQAQQIFEQQMQNTTY